jgi:hypothetical protein
VAKVLEGEDASVTNLLFTSAGTAPIPADGWSQWSVPQPGFAFPYGRRLYLSLWIRTDNCAPGTGTVSFGGPCADSRMDLPLGLWVPSPTPTISATATRSATPTFRSTSSPTETFTATVSPTITPSGTETSSPTFTLSPTRSYSATFPPSRTATQSATPTPVPQEYRPSVPLELDRSRFSPSRERVAILGQAEHGGPLSLDIHNILGARVKRVASWEARAGEAFRLSWDGLNEAGEPVGSGIYLVALHGPSASRVLKVLVLRD